VPAEVALEAVEDCGKKGVKGLVVITAGFREIGEVGMAREARLLAVCDAYDMTMIGPNCMGVINTHPDIRMDATFAPTPPLGGRKPGGRVPHGFPRGLGPRGRGGVLPDRRPSSELDRGALRPGDGLRAATDPAGGPRRRRLGRRRSGDHVRRRARRPGAPA